MKRLRIQTDRLLVSEVFDSLQGEGPSVGRPSTFLRLGLCNLACQWCDSAYTWDAKRHDLASELQAMTFEEVLERLSESSNFVITGGEPMLQQDAVEVLLRSTDVRVEVETAGTIAPSAFLAERVSQWNVSPKLASSRNALTKRRVADVLQAFVATETAVFKFVICDDEDLREAEVLIDGFGVAADRVWLMAEGTDPDTLTSRGRWLAETCVQRGYNLGGRLHVMLWGDKRGV